MAAKKNEVIKVAGGIGESTVFVASPDDAIREEQRDWTQLTVNGKPIPDYLHGQMPYDLTDQGMEEERITQRKAQLRARGDEDPSDKAVTRFRDDLRTGRVSTLGAAMERDGVQHDGSEDLDGFGFDPFAVLMREHLKPGERGLMMSTAACSTKGFTRGNPGVPGSTVKYEPVLDKDGKRIGLNGDASRMFLAKVSESAAVRAERANAGRARDMAVRAQDKIAENNERISAQTKRRAARESDVSFEGLSDDTEAALQSSPEFIPRDASTNFVG